MRRRIYFNISLLATTAVVLASILLVVIFYNFYITEEKQSLKDHSHIIANALEIMEFNGIENITNVDNLNYRTTLIDNTGRVIIDSSMDPKGLENHIDREEVKEALYNGFGESIRYSTTIGKDTYYYAILLSNNSILRISREIDNIVSVFMRSMPGVLIIIISILIIALFISSILTKNILKPVEETTYNIKKIVDGEELGEMSIYEELIPFIKAVIKQSEEINLNIKALKEKADTIEVITLNMKEGLILVDKNKIILSVNPSGVKILGGNEKTSYSGNNFIRLCRNIEINEALHDSINFMESKDLTIKSFDRYLDLFISPIISNGSVLGAVILVVDSTERHKLDMIRREFSANVSHELKTPLTAINGYAEMIETGMAKGEDINRFASIIRNEGIRLLDLIDSIIKLSKIEEEQSNEYSPIDISIIAKDIVGRLSSTAVDKNIDLSISSEKTIINGNKTMIEELLFNLIDNSIKYTNPWGKVNVSIDKDQNNTYIRVSDTGIGIPKKDQDRIFERFYVVDKSRSKKTQSTGLGLSIVKHIVEYHHGNIELISDRNKGAEIIVTLPNLISYT